MNLQDYRNQYKSGEITFKELEVYWNILSDEKEMDRFWNAPVYDRPNIVIGKSQKEMDDEWNEIVETRTVDVVKILEYLDKNDIDYRLCTNYYIGYIFYFIDGSVFPRIHHDHNLDKKIDYEIVAESVDHLIETTLKTNLSKDWIHRIEGEDLNDTFIQVEDYINEMQLNNK